MMNGVDRKTFEGYDTDSKLLTLYDYAHATWDEIQKVKRWKPLNAGANLIGGIIGGVIAVCAYLKFLK